MSDSKSVELDDAACPLPWPQQRRNLILFAVCTGMQYLAAPVLYVGITQSALCEKLGANARVSNLPATLYFAMTAMPILMAWLWPQVGLLRRNISWCYGLSGIMLGLIALALTLPISDNAKLGIVVLQGALTGALMPAAIAFLWEIVCRGSAPSKRGLALALAFGFGPILAVVGSLVQTTLLGGNLFGFNFVGSQYPRNFIILFALGSPILIATAFVSRFFVVPATDHEPTRESVASVIGLLIGLPSMLLAIALVQMADVYSSHALRALGYLLAVVCTAAFLFHFRSLLASRVLLLATIVTILVYSGNMIPSNMNLYSTEALGESPEKFAGMQNTMRFSFKVVAGLFLGWLLLKTNPRSGLIAAASIFLLAQFWAMFATGPLYLVAFGIYGAGELIGVYAPNYIVSASSKKDLRRNTAFLTLLMAPAAPAGYLFGAIVDACKSNQWTLMGLNPTSLGFRLSFLTCALLILSGILLAMFKLPKYPIPTAEER
jgi:MFS family permease